MSLSSVSFKKDGGAGRVLLAKAKRDKTKQKDE
jgi:hypothetical protein